MFLKISQYSQENTCVGVSLGKLIKSHDRTWPKMENDLVSISSLRRKNSQMSEKNPEEVIWRCSVNEGS